MSKLWMRHSPGRLRPVHDGLAACPVHPGGVPVEVCRACPRFIAIMHEGASSSVFCRPAPWQAGTHGVPRS
jgi:hypothetical protein